MKYLCTETCQVLIGKQTYFVKRGGVVETEEELGDRFICLDSEESTHVVDFLKATEEELTAAKWTFKEAQKAISDAYGVKMTSPKGTKRADIIDKILDARYRSVDSSVLAKPRMD